MWRASIAGLCPFHVWKEMTVDSCGCLKKLPLYSNSVKECTIVISSFGELMVQWDLAVNSRGKSLNGKTKPLELLFIHVSNLWLDWRLHFASGSYFSWIFLVNFICSFIHFFLKESEGLIFLVVLGRLLITRQKELRWSLILVEKLFDLKNLNELTIIL